MFLYQFGLRGFVFFYYFWCYISTQKGRVRKRHNAFYIYNSLSSAHTEQYSTIDSQTNEIHFILSFLKTFPIQFFFRFLLLSIKRKMKHERNTTNLISYQSLSWKQRMRDRTKKALTRTTKKNKIMWIKL